MEIKKKLICWICYIVLFNLMLWNVNSILTNPFSTKMLYLMSGLGALAPFYSQDLTEKIN